MPPLTTWRSPNTVKCMSPASVSNTANSRNGPRASRQTSPPGKRCSQRKSLVSKAANWTRNSYTRRSSGWPEKPGSCRSRRWPENVRPGSTRRAAFAQSSSPIWQIHAIATCDGALTPRCVSSTRCIHSSGGENPRSARRARSARRLNTWILLRFSKCRMPCRVRSCSKS